MMRKDSVLDGTVIGFLMASGAVGCLATGFCVPFHPPRLMVCCLVCTGISSFLYTFSRGRALMFCTLALLGGYLWRQGDLIEQALTLAHIISLTYSSAYGWGIVETASAAPSVTLPLCVIGGGIGLIVSGSIVRCRCSTPAILISAVPLILCLIVTSAVPRKEPLFLFLLGLTLLLTTHRVRLRSAIQGAKLRRILILPAALALAGLFFAMPPSHYSGKPLAVWGRNQLLSGANKIDWSGQNYKLLQAMQISGTPNVNLGQKGPMVQSDRPVMTVTSQIGGTIYLRGQDFDRYDGTKWYSTRRQELFQAECPGTRDTVTYKTRRPLAVKYLPYHPSESEPLINGVSRNSQNLTEFTFTRQLFSDNWEENSGGTVSGLYTQLPKSTADWAAEFIRTHLSPDTSDTAHSIARLVQESAVYSLKTQRMPPNQADFARWFLEESDTGYCVHFATATVVLLRSAGIPARYVEGFLVQVSPGAPTVVFEKDAHAWAEYYITGVGWLPLESTAAAVETAVPPVSQPLPETEIHGHLPNPKDPSSDLKPDLWFPGSRQSELLHLLTFILLLSALTVQSRLRIMMRRKRQRTGTPVCRIVALWQQARLFSQLLRQPIPRHLTDLALRAKFGEHEFTSEDISAFHAFFTESIVKLNTRFWIKRIYYRLIRAAY